jgi:O-antigen/teichoic acid export membrane protein
MDKRKDRLLMNNMNLKWSTLITVTAALAILSLSTPVSLGVRPLLTIGFLLFCPGMAFIQLLQFKDLVQELVLAVALSLALDLLVAAAILYAGLWSPTLIMLILVGLSIIGVLCHLLLWYGVRRPLRNNVLRGPQSLERN